MNKEQNDETILAGTLLKKGTPVNLFDERYVELKRHNISIYIHRGDEEPCKLIPIARDMEISEIKEEYHRIQKKNIYIFKVSWTTVENLNPDDASHLSQGLINTSSVKNETLQNEEKLESFSTQFLKQRKKETQAPQIENPEQYDNTVLQQLASFQDKSKFKKGNVKHNQEQKINTRSSDGWKVVGLAVGGVLVGALTAGVGLAAAAIIASVSAAAGGAAVYQTSDKGRVETVTFAADTQQVAQQWTSKLLEMIKLASKSPYWGNIMGFSVAGELCQPPTPETHLEDVKSWTQSSLWEPVETTNSLRIFQLQSTKTVAPCRKVHLVIRTSPLNVLLSIMKIGETTLDGVIQSVRRIEKIDDHSDVIHLKLNPLWIFPTWTAPRDLCVMRYWRMDANGVYTVCLDSVVHRECPYVPGFTRAELHSVFTIAPKIDDEDDQNPECLLTFFAQLNPQGWIWKRFGYDNFFLNGFMMLLLDIRDACEKERFMSVKFQSYSDQLQSLNETAKSNASFGGVGLDPSPALPVLNWGEPDSKDFNVRGKYYLTDKGKIPSAESLFHLVAIDLFQTSGRFDNVAKHPENRVQVALAKGNSPYIVLIHIQIPGPPYYSFVAYFVPTDPKIFEKDIPFTRIAKPFFFGEDDEYRHQRFKLIPKIVEGNWVVRNAVGSTPALLGTKLTQRYFRGENYFELCIDIGSSSVAHRILGLAKGYAKSLIVDMGILLEGRKEEELPEVMIGCIRCKNMDFDTAKMLYDN